jgi:hypothetical protein
MRMPGRKIEILTAAIALLILFSATAFSADVTVRIETKEVTPGETAFLRMLLESDIPISALRVPITMESPWITLQHVGWEFTVARTGFFNTTDLADTNRTDVINVLPKVQSPIPKIPPPGGEICRFWITVEPDAPELFVSVDSFLTELEWVDASDDLGTSYFPDFVAGGIEITNNPTAVDDEVILLPASFELNQNHPNPFNPSTIISFSLPRSVEIDLVVYDVLGREIAALAQGRYPAGYHQVSWNAADQPSGVYFYRLSAGDQTSTRKMLLIK